MNTIIAGGALIALISNLAFPQFSLFSDGALINGPTPVLKEESSSEILFMVAQNAPQVESQELSLGRFRAVVTAYSSRPEETDSTPFITAKGTYVRDGVVAANFLKFGTRVRFPELFGQKVFVVEDRMHSRFFDRVDIWFAETQEAKKFGKRYILVEVIEG